MAMRTALTSLPARLRSHAAPSSAAAIGGLRLLSDGKGRVLSEEERAQESIYIQERGRFQFYIQTRVLPPSQLKTLNLMSLQDKPFNFVLLGGTWSNSAALYRRLKERWTSIWGDEDIPCITLSALSASVMRKLRPQPAWDRTCTSAAAAGLLWELNLRPELSAFELGKQAEAVVCSLDVLLDSLTARRVRLGQSITRKQRHNRNWI